MAPEPTVEERELLSEIVERFHSVDDTIHKQHRDRWDHWDRLYHSKKDLTRSLAEAAPRDKYPIIGDARQEFGHELFIPYAFSVVETVLPRLLSNRPRMQIFPRNGRSEQNVENMKATIDAQQEQIAYELKLQTIAKSGLIRGLGVQKTGWKRRVQTVERVEPAHVLNRMRGMQYKVVTCTEPLFDDPYAEAVDVYNFFWDGYADSIENASWVIHRAWRNTRYCLERFDKSEWTGSLTLEDLDGGKSANVYTDAWAGRLEAQSLSAGTMRDTDIHEVWEYHDRNQIVTVLDRQWIVRVEPNREWHGRLPFQCYRPTEVLNSFVGKGEIEPIEDLQLEMNMLRTDRRWNALLKLHQAYAYTDGVVDPTKIKIGPGALIPVNGDARELLHPLTVGDIPNSGYQEEINLQADIERTSGISDSVSGGDAPQQTATGAQLTLAAANARIQNKTRRVEVEVIKPGAEHWVAMNQRYILAEREMRQAASPGANEPERRWTWFKVGPGELAGQFEVAPEGGSTAPDNTPQKRQDGQMKMALLSHPAVNARELMLQILEDFGVKAPESLLQPEVRVPPETLDLIVQGIVNQAPDELKGQAMEAAKSLVQTALNMALDAEEQGGPPQMGQEQPQEQDAPVAA